MLFLCRIFCRKITLSALVFLLSLSTARAQSGNPEKEFIMSCTYGVLAGTLVGAASLAFTDKPGDNLQRVARGASLGLYAGIALGYYTVYYLPKKFEQQEEERLNPDNVYQKSHENLNQNHFAFYPTLVSEEAENASAGVGFQFQF